MAPDDGRFGIEDLLSARGMNFLRLDAATADFGKDGKGRGRVALLLDSGCLAENDHPGLRVAFRLLRQLKDRGYRLGDLPDGFDAFRSHLNDANLLREDGSSLSYIDYALEFAQLPAARRAAIEAGWGTAEQDRRYRPGRTDCGRFSLPVMECGDVAVALLGDTRAPVPRHWQVALAFWLANDFRADMVALIGAADPRPVAARA